MIFSIHSLYQIRKKLKGLDFALLNRLNDLNSFIVALRPRGGMVTQRIANPFIPVRFWTWPPKKLSCFILLIKYVHQYSSVAQLVEQLTVNQLVAGSSPARGAKIKNQKV